MTSNTRRVFRGDAAQSGSPVLDRRYWPREPARDAEAVLSWKQGETVTTIRAHLLDLSTGGAAIQIERRPPRGVVLQLGLTAVEGVTVDGRAVALRMDGRTGWSILHLKFITECPRALYEQAVGGDDLV